MGNQFETIYTGFYNNILRQPGDVFNLLKREDFSPTWMKQVADTVPATVHQVGRGKPHRTLAPFGRPKTCNSCEHR